MTYVDTALLDLTELCCRRFQLLTGRTNIWLAIQLTNLSIIVYFVWAALVFSISDGQVRIVLGVFCTAVLYALSETVFKVSIEAYENSAYHRVAKGFRNPRRVRDALLRISFLTLSIFLAYPVVFLYRQYHVGIALLTYCLIVLTTVVLYLLACDPLPPCPGKAWEWLKGLARPRRSVTDVRGAGLRRAIVSALAAAAGWLCVAAAAQPPAAIGIDAGTVQGRLSPLLYGQFIEFMFAGIKRGLHAELLRNRSFEEAGDATGLSRYWERYPDSRNDDYAITFSRDAAIAFPPPGAAEGALPPHSLRVELHPGVVARHGIYQARVPVRQGIEYRGYVWIRTNSWTGSVSAAIEADGSAGRVYAEAAVADVRDEARRAESGEWRKYEFVLRPAADDPLARFALLFTGSGTVWVDHVSLMPGDARDGVRADVMDAIAALAPRFIRWPGGNVAQDYHWQWGIGPRDERPPWINLAWKNEIEPGDFGTDEFIRFARAAGAEPSITVNVEGRGATAAEASAWVEYCNGPSSSRYGAVRARNGHPVPYGVKYWEIGNEIFGNWVRGHADAATYARRFDQYVAAMRAVDPSVQVIAVGDNDLGWNRTVLQSVRERIDFLAVHHYYGRRDMDGDLRNLLARPLHYERWYADLDAVLRELTPDRRPRLAINEWGLDLPEAQQYSIAAALYAARLMHVFERRSDLVAMSAVSDLVNGWPGGIIQAADDAVFVTPIYLVNKLYASHAGAERLAVTVDGPTFTTTKEGRDIPALDVVASRSADGRTMFVKAVNLDLEQAHAARITVRSATVAGQAVVDRVVADSLTAANGFRTPDAVRMTRSSIPAGNSFSLELPPHSVSVATLTITP